MANGHGGKRKGAGRKPGSTNAASNLLKEAVVEAAAAIGDGAGREGLLEYLKARAEDSPAAFMQLLGKAMPLQVQGDSNNPIMIQTISYGDPPAE